MFPPWFSIKVRVDDASKKFWDHFRVRRLGNILRMFFLMHFVHMPVMKKERMSTSFGLTSALHVRQNIWIISYFMALSNFQRFCPRKCFRHRIGRGEHLVGHKVVPGTGRSAFLSMFQQRWLSRLFPAVEFQSCNVGKSTLHEFQLQFHQGLKRSIFPEAFDRQGWPLRYWTMES